MGTKKQKLKELKKYLVEQSEEEIQELFDCIYTKAGICEKQIVEEIMRMKIVFKAKKYHNNHLKRIKPLQRFYKGMLICPNDFELPKKIRMAVYSDMMLQGSTKDTKKLNFVDDFLDFAISQNANLIVDCGDVNAQYNPEDKINKSEYEKRLEYLCRRYPKVNQKIHILSGDQDQTWNYDSRQIIKDLCNLRTDLEHLGKTNANINFNDMIIHAAHDRIGKNIKDPYVIIRGHSYEFSIKIKNNSLYIAIPSVEKIEDSIKEQHPGGLLIDIEQSQEGIFYSVDFLENHRCFKKILFKER